MAVFKMGALVTEIAGSIGGTTFRRFRSSFVMYNKSMGGPKSKLLSNPKLAYLGWLFKQWRTLTVNEKGEWVRNTESYTFPDKFGNNRVLSPKDFFVKVNGNLSGVGEYIKEGDGFNGDIALYTVTDFTIDYNENHAIIDIDGNNTENYYLFQCVVNDTYPSSFVFNRTKLTTWTKARNEFQLNLWTYIIAQFPNLRVGQFVTVYHCTMSLSGLKGVKSYSVAEVV